MDLTNPFSPDQMPGAGQPQPLVDRWKSFLSDPNSQAAIMSFGASLATPMGFGSTPAGHISQAVGHAGKTVTNRNAETRKDLETDSRVDARETSANNATMRSQVAQQNADTAVERARIAGVATESQNAARDSQNALRESQREVNSQRVRMLELQVQLYPENEDLKQQLLIARTQAIPRGLDIQQQRADTQRTGMEATHIGRAQDRDVRARQGTATLDARERAQYDKYLNEVRKRNSDPLRPSTQRPEPELSVEDWKKSRGGGAPSPQGPGRPSPAPSQPRSPTQPASNIQVPLGAIDALRRDPSLAPQFDAKYGLGLSETYLGRQM